MNSLKVFENEELGNLRVVEIENEPYFLGTDVAAILQYSDKNKAVQMHVDSEDKKVLEYKAHDISSEALWNNPNDFSDKVLINESGLYSMILSSQLPSARKFKRWVTSDVLPSIRKTGGYHLPQTYAEALRELADKAEENERLKLEVVHMNDKIIEMQPKVTYLDEILQSNKTMLTTQIAQDYGMSARGFNKKLHDLGVQHKVGNQWILYSKYQGFGYVHSKTHFFNRKNGREDYSLNTEWTQKGRLFLYEFLKRHNCLPLIEREDDYGTNDNG